MGSRKKKVALTLSSGGARGLVHVGVIEELLAQGYEITSIAGCSMGALVGGVFAAGKLAEFREWMKSIDKRKMLNMMDLSLSINHMVKGERVMEALHDIVGDVRIEDLPIPYCAIATDWRNGCEVVFRNGRLLDAIRASIAYPSFLNPVKRDNMILIDGGITNPLPLNRVARTKGDILMGVDVSGHDYQGQSDLKQAVQKKHKNDKSVKRTLLNLVMPDSLSFNHVTLLMRTASLMIKHHAKLMVELTHPDILIDVQLNRLSGLDFYKSEKFIVIGHNRARQALQTYQSAHQSRWTHLFHQLKQRVS